MPTFNSAVVLPMTLPALLQQTTRPAWQLQLIISDDGSTDDTVAVAQELSAASAWQTLVITGPHSGAAAARNRALAQAEAEVIFFLGADIILRPNALAAHLRFHTQHPDPSSAALGHVRWDPRIAPSPLMEWMSHGGPQNDFDSLLGRARADARHYFTASHLSIKKAALGEMRFPEDYRTYGWEDLDLGRTLARELKLYVLHAALGLHQHYYGPRQVLKRQRSVGQNSTIYQRRHPHASILPVRGTGHRLKYSLARSIGLLAGLRALLRFIGPRWSLPAIFSLATAAEFWRGAYSAPSYPQTGKGYPHNFPQ